MFMTGLNLKPPRMLGARRNGRGTTVVPRQARGPLPRTAEPRRGTPCALSLGSVKPAYPAARAELLSEEGRVCCHKPFLVFGQLVDRVQRVGRADRDTGAAIDAAFRIHVELSDGLKLGFVFLGMDAVGRAHIDAEQVLDAGIGNYVSHDERPLGRSEDPQPDARGGEGPVP